VSLNQEEFVELLADQHAIPKDWAEDILKDVLGIIGGALKQDIRVRIRNFGTWEMRESHGEIRPKFDASKNLLEEYGRDEMVPEEID
jgi:nucleoid DNA-binding protein